MNKKEWVADNRWFLTVVSVTICGVAIWVAYRLLNPEAGLPDESKPMTWGPKFVLILYSALVGWFLDIFTGEATMRKVDHMVAFCYVFPFAIFAGILLPLFAYPVALPDPPKPIGVILGCSEPPDEPLERTLVPDGIRCGNHSDQWLVNIGGDAIPVEYYVRTPKPTSTPKDLKGNDDSTVKDEPKATAETKVNDDKKVKDAVWKSPYQSFVVTGGLVVPLYFVILAIFGGFVSMLRRVPEIQERVTSLASYPLSKERAREKLVFEVLQLLAAPLIAITAYYLVDPSSRASSIALAFIAGFSSETVLLYVRALAEKLQPQTARRTEVEVIPTALEFKKQIVGTESEPQTVKFTNRSGHALSGTATVSPEFACVPLGAFTIAPGSSTLFSVTFKPATTGNKLGQLQFDDDGPGSPRVLRLSGEAQEAQPPQG
jgi:hypothetical protein